MTHSPPDVLALFAAISLLAAIGLLLVGMVVYSVPGRLVLGQQLMRLGAVVALLMIFTCAAYGVFFAGRVPTWQNVGVFLLGLPIMIGKPLWKVINKRRNAPPLNGTIEPRAAGDDEEVDS